MITGNVKTIELTVLSLFKTSACRDVSKKTKNLSTEISISLYLSLIACLNLCLLIVTNEHTTLF